MVNHITDLATRPPNKVDYVVKIISALLIRGKEGGMVRDSVLSHNSSSSSFSGVISSSPCEYRADEWCSAVTYGGSQLGPKRYLRWHKPQVDCSSQ